MFPVPGYPVSTPYARRGSHWSCNPDLSGNGLHTGLDIAAPAGTPVLACRPGRLAHVNYGSAFGDRQVAVRCDDGTEDFYAHMEDRTGEAVVSAGDWIGRVGERGNATGPHLHLERHPSQGFWSCDNHTDPGPSIEWEDFDMTPDDVHKIVHDEVLNIVRQEGISGSSDASLMRSRYAQVGGMPPDGAGVASVLRSEGVTGASDAALMRDRFVSVGGMPSVPLGGSTYSVPNVALLVVLLLDSVGLLGLLVIASVFLGRQT